MASTIYLVRHGESEHNVSKDMSQLDPPLTTLGFPHELEKRCFDLSSEFGVENGIELTLEPDLQERSGLPCDTGSERHVLEKDFPNLALEELSEGWQAKARQYAADDDSVTLRAGRMREKLKHLNVALHGNEKRDIVVVTHGMFMKFLSSEGDIDLPKAGWKSYTISNDGEDGAILLPVNEAQKS
ncbi:hypothetical protein CC86DRAFT_450628 [Ophiobolus disseminans]|uniref:Phosphoglycerate mutase-like protein n=1 Tax=Ophiobolus disseminans TaxID=1469910 RepID=A0A6A6ZBW9_9PLEO|nr:hypothetical protein CC86DRAFT_450628 [Ophiobolus disseminans]